MMLGPCSAPSSPPEIPAPTKWIPRSRNAPSRLRVSSKNELPPSISTSPGSRCGASSPMTASTAAPALTMIRMRRERALVAIALDELARARGGPVVDGHRDAVPCQVAGQVLAHHGQARDAEFAAVAVAGCCVAHCWLPPCLLPGQVGEDGTGQPLAGMLAKNCG